MVAIDSNLLLNFYQARLGGLGGNSGASSPLPSRKYAPTAPWNAQMPTGPSSPLVKAAMQGRRYIDENAAQLDLPGASSDYRKMFALYQGLETLLGVAEGMQAKGVANIDATRMRTTFARGMREIGEFIDKLDLDIVRLTRGEVSTSARTKVGVPRTRSEYVTAPLVSGASDALVPAFQGAVAFNVKVQKINGPVDVAIDLSEMGAQPRTLANVLNHINGKLEDAGVSTRFASQRLPAAERTVTVGGKTVKLPAGPDQWAMKVKVDSGETVSFEAAATAPSVYIAQRVGDPDPDGKSSTDDAAFRHQLLKFQTDASTVAAPIQGEGETHWVDGRAFAKTLGPEIAAVRQTKVGPDGSVYVLADVKGPVGGQPLKGEQDVALIKYDRAGNMVYARTLGASDEASGLALEVAADGRVAVAGSVKGGLNGADDGALNSNGSASFAENTDSFVTLFDAEGQEVWTQRRGARLADEATHIAFGGDGEVYVAGRTRSVIPGGSAVVGGYDSYLQGFKADPDGKVQSLFTTVTGTAGEDRAAGLVVDGQSMVAATVEEGRAVLRRYDLSGGAPVLTATRDLGQLMGGEITGLALDGGQVVVAGSTGNAALAAGTVTRAHAGGSDVFVARLSSDLSAQPGDAVAYYGGSGDDRAAGLAVAGGQVWLTGQAGADLPDEAAVGEKDGFLVRLDVAAGQVDYSRRFTGKDGFATPGAIAVDLQGASVLDRLGLPQGQLQLSDSPRLTAVSGIRPGESFQVAANGGRAKTITIEGNDTLDTLATKLRRAMGFQAKVEIVTVEGYRRLNIKPLNDRHIIELSAGKEGKDALEVLGLSEGVVRATRVVDGKTVAADGKAEIYGLGFPSDLKLDTEQDIRHALAEITGAQGVIRKAYRDLVQAATPRNVLAQQQAASGPAPAYLTNQIANYQAALNRLTGGGG